MGSTFGTPYATSGNSCKAAENVEMPSIDVCCLAAQSVHLRKCLRVTREVSQLSSSADGRSQCEERVFLIVKITRASKRMLVKQSNVARRAMAIAEIPLAVPVADVVAHGHQPTSEQDSQHPVCSRAEPRSCNRESGAAVLLGLL